MDIRGNHLVELPNEILKLKNLERLDLRWNQDLKKPEWIDRMNSDCLIYF